MCECIAQANQHLAEFNTKIDVPIWTRSGVLAPFVSTVKLDDKKRGKPKLMFASCCPFCGEKYAKIAQPGTEHSSQDQGGKA